MKTHRLVLPGDLNQFGFLFGGRLLSWIDEASWIAASLDYPACHFVTIGMEAVTFRESAREGIILEIESNRHSEGRTSVTYEVVVRVGQEGKEREIFSTKVSFVNVDKEGRKVVLGEGIS